MSQVKLEKVLWVWQDRIPQAALTVVDGDPGLGKTTAVLDLASRLTRGVAMPGEPAPLLPASDVVVMSLEDSLGATLKPRMEAAGADPERVIFVTEVTQREGSKVFTRPPAIPTDVELLQELVQRRGAKMVVIDPLMAALDGSVDSHKDQEIRRALKPLSDMALKTGCAVIIIRHLSKGVGASAVYRGGGSIGIIGAARSGLLVAKDPESPRDRILAQVKNNVGPTANSVRFGIVQDPQRSVGMVAWGDACELSADDLVDPRTKRSSERSSQAKALLTSALQSGALPVETLREMATAAGIGWRTLERAKSDLGYCARQRLGHRGWVWYNPAAPQLAPSAQIQAGPGGDA